MSGNEAVLAVRLTHFLDISIDSSFVQLEDSSLLEKAFVFALIWCCGCQLSIGPGKNSKLLFGEWFRKAFPSFKIPSGGSIFDYYINTSTGNYELWREHSLNTLPEQIDYKTLNRMFIPSGESTAVCYFADKLLQLNIPLLIRGKSGCGKTMLGQHILRARGVHVATNVTFIRMTKLTTVAELSAIFLTKSAVEQKMYFIDDIEFSAGKGGADVRDCLRILIEHRQCFDFRTRCLSETIQSSISILGTADENKFCDDDGLKSAQHFVQFLYQSPSSSQGLVLLTLTERHLILNGVSSEIRKLCKNIVKASQILFDQIEASFRPSPIKPSYHFAFATLCKIFKAFHQCTTSICFEAEAFMDYWLHEFCCSTLDTLMGAEDRDRFHRIAHDVTKKELSQFHFSKFFSFVGGNASADPLLFSHFSDRNSSSVSEHASMLPYEHVDDFALAKNSLRELLGNSCAQIALFDAAVIVIAKVARLISLNESAFLIGPPCCGKTLLVNLACRLLAVKPVQLIAQKDYSYANFMVDWMELSTLAGVRGEKVVLYVRESELHDEKIFATLCMIASSVLPLELYSPEYRTHIIAQLAESNTIIALNSLLSWNTFLTAVQENVCIIITASLSTKFRHRCNLSPKLFSHFR